MRRDFWFQPASRSRVSTASFGRRSRRENRSPGLQAGENMILPNLEARFQRAIEIALAALRRRRWLLKLGQP
jgi:hypothetical protein